jgi:F-type H+-transporting ATPase subunit delta
MIRRFARPYAAAIMDVAESTEKAAAVLAELERFAEILRGSDELQAVFENPGVEAAGKAGVVTAIAVRIGISALGQKILDVILKNDRINDLGDILEALGDMINTATNTVVAEVRSAHVLDESERERLRKALETKLGQRSCSSSRPIRLCWAASSPRWGARFGTPRSLARSTNYVRN